MSNDRNIRMHTLAVVANPEPLSLTHHISKKLAAALPPESFELADLSEEGFDPTFTRTDRGFYQEGNGYPDDVRREHQRLDRATDLVLIFPVYWWSMPALLKGWIDRVFVNGWAFDYSPASGLQPRLHTLTTHLVPVAGTDAATYERHGYEQALRTQIEHGIVDFCGSRRGATTFLYDSEEPSNAATEQKVDRAIRTIGAAIHTGANL